MGRQNERDAGALELEQPLPHDVAGLRVQPGGGFVEQHHPRVVHQRPGDREPALHAAGEGVDARVGPVGELDELQQLVGPGPARLPGQPEVAPVDDEVVPDGQFAVQAVLLRHDAQAGADRRTVGGRVESEDAQHAAGRRRGAADHPHRRTLARAVRAEEAERLARQHVDVDPVDRDPALVALAEGLDQAARRDQRGGPEGRSPPPRRWQPRPWSRSPGHVTCGCRRCPRVSARRGVEKAGDMDWTETWSSNWSGTGRRSCGPAWTDSLIDEYFWEPRAGAAGTSGRGGTAPRR